jgi:ketosteroid isomerase-like protein
MSEIDWSTAHPIDRDQLPTAIVKYLAAHEARDLDTAMGFYAPDATVTDEGHTHVGQPAIRGWLGTSASEYTYTTRLTAAAAVDEGHYDAVHHLEGDFPGGVADLHFRFSLRDDHIDRLVIEP